MKEELKDSECTYYFNERGKKVKVKKKYKLDKEDTVIWYSHRLYRIIAIKDFGNVSKGDKGGYVESEKNLSHFGKSWIYDEAKACGEASIEADAHIHDDVIVYGSIILCGISRASGNALLFDNYRRHKQ